MCSPFLVERLLILTCFGLATKGPYLPVEDKNSRSDFELERYKYILSQIQHLNEGIHKYLSLFQTLTTAIVGGGVALFVHIQYQPQTVSTPSELAQSIDLRVFPNPTRITLFIEAQDPIRQVKLYTMEGKEVFSREMNTRETQVRSTALSQGVFLLKLRFDKGHIIKRILWE